MRNDLPTWPSSLTLLWRAVALFVGAIYPQMSQADGSVSDAAQAVLDRYRLEYCEEAKEVRGQPILEGTSPIFLLETGGYRMVALTLHGSTAEIIYTGNMTCAGGHIGTCGSGGCLAHIIFDDMDYPIRGSGPFLLVPQGTEIGSDDANEVTAVIAWYGWGGYCRTQEDPETERLRTCLLTAYVDPDLSRLTFQHDYDAFPR